MVALGPMALVVEGRSRSEMVCSGGGLGGIALGRVLREVDNVRHGRARESAVAS